MNLTEALTTECTHGDRREYALRQLEALLDECREFEGARVLIDQRHNRALQTIDQRERLKREAE